MNSFPNLHITNICQTYKKTTKFNTSIITFSDYCHACCEIYQVDLKKRGGGFNLQTFTKKNDSSQWKYKITQ